MGLYCAFDAPVINKDLHESTGHVIKQISAEFCAKGSYEMSYEAGNIKDVVLVN